MLLRREMLEAIEKALQRGERVELIPCENGVKIIRIRREELKQGNIAPHP